MKTSPAVPHVRTQHQPPKCRLLLRTYKTTHLHFEFANVGTPTHLILRNQQVPKNAKGGILVCEEELKAAFDFFDVDMKGVITASNLRKRLGAFHRSLSARVGDEMSNVV